MADRSGDGLLADVENLIGCWKCYAGDGIHDWDDRIIAFRTVDGRLSVEQLIPAMPGAPGGSRRWGPYFARYSRGRRALELTIDDGDGEDQSLWHIRPAANTLALWQTGVGYITLPRYNNYRRIEGS